MGDALLRILLGDVDARYWKGSTPEFFREKRSELELARKDPTIFLIWKLYV